MAGPHVTTYSSDVSLSDHQLASPTVKYYISPLFGGERLEPGGWLTSIRRGAFSMDHTCQGTPRLRLTVPCTRARHNRVRSLLSKHDSSECGCLSKRVAAQWPPVDSECCKSGLYVHAGSDRDATGRRPQSYVNRNLVAHSCNGVTGIRTQLLCEKEG